MLPAWMAKVFPHSAQEDHFDNSEQIAGLQRPRVRKNRERRNGNLGARKTKRVCRTCNNGWLSGLEETAKPILMPLITGARTVLAGEEARVLSLWLVKTAISYEALWNEAVLGEAARRSLMNSFIGDDIRVFVGSYASEFIERRLYRYVVHIPDAVPLDVIDEELPVNAMSFVVVVGAFVGNVVVSPATFPVRVDEFDPDTLRLAHPTPVKPIVIPLPKPIGEDRLHSLFSAYYRHLTGLGLTLPPPLDWWKA